MTRLSAAIAVFVALPFIDIQACFALQDLPVGFEAADADKSGGVSAAEMEKYLADRLGDEDLKHGLIFKQIEVDKDGSISSEEFDHRHAAIEKVMGSDYLGGGFDDPDDPGKDYVPFKGLDQQTHDGKVLGAVFHRFNDLSNDAAVKWPANTVLSKVPESLGTGLSQSNASDKPTLRRLFDSTVILGGGGGMEFFTAGAVLISEDGLALTNYHVAEFLKDGKMAAITTDGKCHPVVELLAGNKDRDVALIRLQGSGFSFVNVAATAPKIGEDIEMVHHSENRFYTYDRGYVMRHPVLGEHPWMEISADYAPGGSGCGIYNDRRELVGLVSIIQFGDGPSLAEDFNMDVEDEDWGEEGDGDMSMQDDGAMLLVKHAVSLPAIRSLWEDSAAMQKTKRKLKAGGK